MKNLLLLLLICSCSEVNNTKEIYFHDNTICRKAIGQYCGAELYECENGKNYYCVTNLKSEIINQTSQAPQSF